MNDAELEGLLDDLESDRVERKESISDSGKIREMICAFANDMPNHGQPGVLFVGVRDDGSCTGLQVTDKMLLTLSDMRSDGNILPFPTMTVQKKVLRGCELAVVVVDPSYFPPVRYKGRVWIRVGPRRATATAEEERRLNEKRRAADLPVDLTPLRIATLDDLDLDLFTRTYLPAAVAPEVLEENTRSVEEQMLSLRFLASGMKRTPTVTGVLAIAKTPAAFVPGSYVQFLRIDGTELSDPITDQKELHGPLPELMKQLDDIAKANIHIATDVVWAPTEVRTFDYPIPALQQLLRNAVMHRDYHTSNAPIRFTWFSDRIEIQNPGGPYGQVTRDNFGRPGITDYRNPNVSEVMRNLGFVQRFGVGIQIVREELKKNGNLEPEFHVEDNYILVTVRKRP